MSIYTTEEKAPKASAEISKIEDKIKSVVAESLKVDPSNILPNSRFVDDLGADSLDTVELMMAIEAAFPGCDIPDDEASKISTVADAVKYVAAHLVKS